MRFAILTSGLLLLTALSAAAEPLRAYQGADGRLHFTDVRPRPAHTFALLDEAVLAERPLLDATAPANVPSTAPAAANLAAAAVTGHPVRTVLIDRSAPAIAFIDGAELTAGAPLPRADRTPSPANGDIEALLRHHARLAGLDSRLVVALARVESNLNPRAVSPKGAMGVMQLMPGTARELGVTRPFDPAQSIRGGVAYLKQQLERFGTLDLALAAYNAGPAAVEQYGGVPPYAETRDYIRKIKRLLATRQG